MDAEPQQSGACIVPFANCTGEKGSVKNCSLTGVGRTGAKGEIVLQRGIYLSVQLGLTTNNALETNAENKGEKQFERASLVQKFDLATRSRLNSGRQCINRPELTGRAQKLMPEMSNPGENHGHAQAVGGFNHLLIAYRASRLNDGGCPCPGDFLDAIRKGEEGIGGGHAAFQR